MGSFGKMLKGSGQVAWTKQLYDYYYYCAATSDHSFSLASCTSLHNLRRAKIPILASIFIVWTRESTNKTNSTHFTCVFLAYAHTHIDMHTFRMYSTTQIYTYCEKYSTWAYASIQKTLVWWYASTNGVGPWKKRRLKTIAKTHWDGETVLNFTLAFVRYASIQNTLSHTQRSRWMLYCCVLFFFFLSILTDAKNILISGYMEIFHRYIRSFVPFFAFHSQYKSTLHPSK